MRRESQRSKAKRQTAEVSEVLACLLLCLRASVPLWLIFGAVAIGAEPSTTVSEPSSTTVSEVSLKARVEPRSVTIGTPFRYVVEIDAPKEAELVIPLLGERFGDFFVTDFGDEPPREEKGRVKVVRWFKLVGYRAGDQTLPAYPVKYKDKGEEDLKDAQANEVTVVIESLMAKEPTPLDIRDIAEPEALPFDWRPIAAAVGVVAALAAVIGLIRYLGRRRAAQAIAAAPKPHEVALEALARLRSRGLLEGGRYEEYYVELSAIIRGYVEGRFGLHAPEMTTEEFLAVMQRDRRLSPGHRRLLGEFLTESDLVKFARYTPRAEDGERAFGAARRFVEESRPLGGEAGRGMESPAYSEDPHAAA